MIIIFDQPLLEWHKLSLKNNNKLEYTVLPVNCRGKVMHGAILPVTIPPPPPPPQVTPRQVQPFGPGVGELFEAVLSRE